MSGLITFIPILCYLPLLLWSFTKQKKCPSYIYEISNGYRCKSCLVDKNTEQAQSMEEYEEILSKKYCNHCNTRIIRSDKISQITGGNLGKISNYIRKIHEFIFTRKFDLMWMIIFGVVFLIYIILLIFIKPYSLYLNSMLFVYWLVIVIRNHHIMKKVQSH